MRRGHRGRHLSFTRGLSSRLLLPASPATAILPSLRGVSLLSSCVRIRTNVVCARRPRRGRSRALPSLSPAVAENRPASWSRSRSAFVFRRGAFERRCVRGATKHIPCVWYFLYPLLQLFVVEKRSKVFVRFAFLVCCWSLLGTHKGYIIGLFFSAKKKKKGRKRAKNCSRVVVYKLLVARILWTSTPHHHHARRSSRLRPRRVAFLAFRLRRFSPVGGARSQKDALPRAVVLKCARFVVGFQREEK